MSDSAVLPSDEGSTSHVPLRGEAEEPEAYLIRAFTAMSERRTTIPALALRSPRTAFDVLLAIRRLPALSAAFPNGPEAAQLQRQLTDHPMSRRLTMGVSAVLETPVEPGGYLNGHERATVRRKVRSARKLGIEVRPVPPEDRDSLRALADHHERENEREQYRTAVPENEDLLDYDLWLAAYDADGAPLVLAVAPRAGEWAVLRYFRTLVAGRASSDARYLMAEALAEALAALGVRYLVDSARPHWLPNGLRHFQGMIGFRLVRISVVRCR